MINLICRWQHTVRGRKKLRPYQSMRPYSHIRPCVHLYVTRRPYTDAVLLRPVHEHMVVCRKIRTHQTVAARSCQKNSDSFIYVHSYMLTCCLLCRSIDQPQTHSVCKEDKGLQDDSLRQRIFTTPVATPVSTPVRIINYARIHIHTCICINAHRR